jgi:preprotein translocase subunit SecF
LQHTDSQSISELKELFTTADLVKFAKHAPMMNENDMNLMNAMDFINRTKVEPDPNAKPEATEITVEEKRSRQGKMVLAVSIALVGVAIVVVIYFIWKEISALWL